MPIHPPAPEGFGELIEAYTQTMQSVIDLGRGCREADFAKPTQCPGWSVQDQFAHIVSLEQWLAGEAYPADEGAERPEHVRNDLGAFTERGVAARRGMTPEAVVDELAEVLPVRQAQLYAVEDPEQVVPSPLGERPAIAALRTRIFDLWTHLQDIRQALGRPGDLETPGAAVFVQLVFNAMPGIVARKAQVPVGQTVVMESTGPTTGRVGVRVEQDEDGRPLGVELYRREASETGVIPVIDPATGQPVNHTSIVLSTDALTRRAAGRVSTQETRYTVHGDEEIARRVLEAITIAP